MNRIEVARNQKDISIIIVNWNALIYLEKCLHSIYSQATDLKYEVIVVDNASTDGSRELVREKFPYAIIICNHTNLGFAKANNIGIMQSSGRYICLINSDVEVLKGCFENMKTYMEQHPEIGMLGPQILDLQGKMQRSCMGFPTLWNIFCRALAMDTLFPTVKIFGGHLLTYWPHNKVRNVDVLNGCFWMIKREALNQVGLLDEAFFIYGEDIDWCKRFWNAGWNVVYFPEAKAIHYGGASSSIAPIRFYLELQKAYLQYWEKHYNRTEYIVFSFILVLQHIIRLLGDIVLYVIQPAKRISITLKINRSLAFMKWRLGFNIKER